MPRPHTPPPSPPLLSPSSLPTRENLPEVEVSMVEAADVTGVTFTPELWMQRRGWALDVLRKEGVRSVLDVGAGPGALLETLIQPASTIPEPPLRPSKSKSASRSGGVEGQGEEGGEEPELFINRLAALDPNPNVLTTALQILTPPSTSDPSSSALSRPRYTPLTTELWCGGIESYNQHLEGYEAMVALEVIEHLDPLVLSRFGVVCLGTYRPRLLLVSTPNFDFNAKFPRHEYGEHDFAHRGFVDPTGRTERVFRHSDHKLEMTSTEFRSWATSAAQDWGYKVDLSGVGISSSPSYYPPDHPETPNAPIYASQVALFRLGSGVPMRSPRSVRSSELPWLSKEAAHPHRLVGRFIHPATIGQSSSGGKGKLEIPPKASPKQIKDKVGELMGMWNVGQVSLGEIWGDKTVAEMCGGSKRYLVGCLGGWGDQESLAEEKEGAGEWEVKREDTEKGGRGLVVVRKGWVGKDKDKEEGKKWGEQVKREEPSEKTGGW